MRNLTDKQLENWVLGLLERAERISGMLDQATIPSIEVAELTGYAKSALVLLNREQAASYRQTHKASKRTQRLSEAEQASQKEH